MRFQFYLLTAAGALLLWSACSKPVAQFIYQKDHAYAPTQVRFTNQSVKADRYEWTFGNGRVSTDVNPIVDFNRPGEYPVVLTAFKGKRKHIMMDTIRVAEPQNCLVEIETVFGTMVVKLHDQTPQHRDNFIKLAREHYFDDLLFHRVINGFMVQGGDPQSRNAKPGQPLGMGGPDYTIPAEFVNDLIHVKGALAAARTGDQVNPEKRSSGSQFYIVQGRPVTEGQLNLVEAPKGFRYSAEQRKQYLTHGGTPFLDRDYTVFGQVIKGLEVIDSIAAQPTAPGDRPKTDIKMKIRVIE